MQKSIWHLHIQTLECLNSPFERITKQMQASLSERSGSEREKESEENNRTKQANKVHISIEQTERNEISRTAHPNALQR